MVYLEFNSLSHAALKMESSYLSGERKTGQAKLAPQMYYEMASNTGYDFLLLHCMSC